jgi:hypothetical protein
MMLLITLISPLWQNPLPHAHGQELPEWREAEPVRLTIQSTSDWGRILFDDLNGTNTNGVRIKSVLGSGWFYGQEYYDIIDVGRKLPWPDEVYGQILVRHGDMVAFFKGFNNFHPTEAYADLILELDLSRPQIYVWLMCGGNGTTSFQITSVNTGGIIWRDIIAGNGVTQQAKRVMTPQPFFRAGRQENFFVISWLGVAIVIIIVLNFPIFELLRRMKRHREA